MPHRSADILNKLDKQLTTHEVQPMTGPSRREHRCLLQWPEGNATNGPEGNETLADAQCCAAQLISKPAAVAVSLPRSIAHSDQVRMQLDVRYVQYLKEHHLHVYLTDLLR